MKGITGFIREWIFNLHFRLDYNTKRVQTNALKKQGRLSIGEYTYGLPIIVDYTGGYAGKVSIGKFCSIADNVCIFLGGQHHTGLISTYPLRIIFPPSNERKDICLPLRGDVVIQNDVWIGRDVLIRDGVTIGNGAIIGCGCVVTKDVAPYEIVAGNPCKRVQMRFSDEEIASLLKVSWWDWDISKISDNMHLLLSPDIEDFIRKFNCEKA